MKKEKKKPIKKISWFWHIHHEVLLEFLTEPLKNRIKFIKENKPKNEIKLRLKLMKPIKRKLPKEFSEAGQKYDEAKQKYDEARQKYKPQIEALHKAECKSCSWNGKSIFK